MSLRSGPLEAPARRITVEPVGGRTWRPIAVVAAIVLVIGAALVKPWDTGTSQHPGAPVRGVAVASATPSSSPGPSIDPVIDAASSHMLCNAPSGWRLVTSETSALGATRTMYGTPPQRASGPTDPSIDTAELRADRLFAIGVCRPNPAGSRVADLPFNGVTIWAVPPTGAPVVVAEPRILSSSLFRLGEAYYGPPDSRTNRESGDNVISAWQPGRYVVEVADATPDAQPLWLALDFTQPVMH